MACAPIVVRRRDAPHTRDATPRESAAGAYNRRMAKADKSDRPKAQKSTAKKATPPKATTAKAAKVKARKTKIQKPKAQEPKPLKAKRGKPAKPAAATPRPGKTGNVEKTAVFAETFATLRAMLQQHGKRLITSVDTPDDFTLVSPTLTDRVGRPLFVAAVQTRKSYVSFHLLPLYMNPTLLAAVSPALRQRMQGKACFNFTTIDADQVKDLSDLTKKGLDSFKTVQLPWATAAK
jgi:hypothetical protein